VCSSDLFVIEPELKFWTRNNKLEGKTLPEGYRYSSDINTEWLDIETLKQMVIETGLNP
jgi:hypothetical protein